MMSQGVSIFFSRNRTTQIRARAEQSHLLRPTYESPYLRHETVLTDEEERALNGRRIRREWICR